ncbi:MAG: alpha/beta fold hydrolase [Glaciimonas sp.]|nr:alpha/beta fold hydrolase [Glaciimonas sp.]
MPKSTPVPFNEGYLPVGDGHRQYFAEYEPAVVVLHGGPGSGCPMLGWFNLSRHRGVLFDQRGACRSVPKGMLAHNTTSSLVEDIKRLQAHLRIAQWLVVGEPWGTTLCILYEGRYSGSASGLVLRGIFLAI